jgi:hypothetical protein
MITLKTPITLVTLNALVTLVITSMETGGIMIIIIIANNWTDTNKNKINHNNRNYN